MSQPYTDEQFVRAYFDWLRIADEAYAAGDGAKSTGAKAHASTCVTIFMKQRGHTSRDEAVAALRRLKEKQA